MNKINLPVIIQLDEDGYFASCPALQGCYTQGDSSKEILENIKDAILLHLEDRIANGEDLFNNDKMKSFIIDDFDLEILRARKNEKLMQYLDQLSEEEAVFSLDDVKKELGLDEDN